MLSQYESKMEKTLENLVSEYAGIRAGRANPHILDKLKVDYYGVPTPIQQAANITVPEARTLMIQPWESSLIKEIEKAILNSDLGLVPNNDGKVVRIGDPTELALLDMNNLYGSESINNYKRVLDLPFDSDRKLMTTVIEVEGKYIAIPKGAPDRVINLCNDSQEEKDAAFAEVEKLLAE